MSYKEAELRHCRDEKETLITGDYDSVMWYAKLCADSGIFSNDAYVRFSGQTMTFTPERLRSLRLPCRNDMPTRAEGFTYSRSGE